jgi:hypothetical protein
VAYAAQSSPGRSLFGGQNVKFFVAGGVIALAVAYLVTMGLQGTTVYFLSVTELQASCFACQAILCPGRSPETTPGLGFSF